MHLCYNDAVFTGSFTRYMSMMLDRELRV